MSKFPVLVSPDGKREWTPNDAVENTNLRARGWKPKDDAPKKSESKSTTTK